MPTVPVRRREASAVTAPTAPKTRQRGRRAPTSASPKAGTVSPSPEAYAAFIRGVELRDVRLTEAHAISHASRFDSEALTVDVGMEGRIERVPAEDCHAFEAHATLALTATDQEGREQARVTATYALRYDSEVEPTDAMLDIFLNLNASVNVWPYLREYAQQTITRFGWTPLVLPSLKTLRP